MQRLERRSVGSIGIAAKSRIYNIFDRNFWQMLISSTWKVKIDKKP
jgi:hypothetical protein